VRYFQLIDLATDQLRADNAGPDHSGLTAEELKNVPKLLNAYRAALQQATRAVLKEPLVEALAGATHVTHSSLSSKGVRKG
jgi:hypothetical protein